MSEFWYGMAAVAVACLVTELIRWLPFMIFKEGKLPAAVEYLGRKMPEAVMVILIIFCLRGTNVTTAPFGLPELISVVVCVFLQVKLKNCIPSIAISTVLYVVLTRFVF